MQQTQFELEIQKFPENRRNLFTVEAFSIPTYKQISTIAKFKPTQSNNEIVVLGAHIDSVNQLNIQGRSPGADDDASGISTIFEVFRVLGNSNFMPTRDIEFMCYSGEEIGLIGSQAIARKYREDQKKVHAVLQIDMDGYVYRDSYKIGVAHDQFVSKDLARFTTKLVDAYTNVGWTESNCAHACSDHASWTRNNYRSVYPPSRPFQSGLNPNIHRDTDTIEKLNFTRMVEYTKMAVGFAVELST